MSKSINRITTLLGTLSRVQKVGFTQSCRNVFYSPQHFPKIFVGIVLSGAVGGYCLMDNIHTNKVKKQNQIYQAAWESNYQVHQRYNAGRPNSDELENNGESSVISAPVVVRTFTRRMTRTRVSLGGRSSASPSFSDAPSAAVATSSD